MPVILSIEGAKLILNKFFKGVDVNNPDDDPNMIWMDLYTNNVTPTITSKKSDFVSAIGGGYARKKLLADMWTLRTVNGIPQAVYDPQIWTFTAPLDSGAKVMGVFLYDEMNNFIGAEKSPFTYTPENRGSYELTPIVQLGNGDITPPVLNSFAIYPPGISATVRVAMSVSDNIGVTEYALSEDPNNFTWRTYTPDGDKLYGFLSEGTKTLYCRIKDDMGNVSEIKSATVEVTLPDSAAPTITSFVVPNIWDTLTVDISMTASDNKAVAEYSVSETSTPGIWTATPPTTYTFASGGQKMLYAFAKDTSGNVCFGVSRTCLITYVDIAPPTITSFILNGTSVSRTVHFVLEALDDNNIAGWCLSETATPVTWTDTKPTEYTFATAGDKNLYAFAKDGTGNVSAGVSRNVVITVTDFVAPVITSFSIPSTSEFLTVPVTLTCDDLVGVVAYCLSETNSPVGWVNTLPTEYTFATTGSKTLYAFVKDAADNVSVPSSSSTYIQFVDYIPPSITSFSIPLTSQSLTVPVTLIANDAIGITGYSLNDTNNPATWSADVPLTYTFTYEGTRQLYAFAKDAAGNVSTSAMAECLINLPDLVKPSISNFTIPATSYFLKVPVAIVATDNINVAYYSLNTTNTPSSWVYDPPTTYTFQSPGVKVLYAFVKDDSGNLSESMAQSCSIVFPTSLTETFDDYTTGVLNISYASLNGRPIGVWDVTSAATYEGNAGLRSPAVSSEDTWHQAIVLKPSVGGTISFKYRVEAPVPNIRFTSFYTVDDGSETEFVNVTSTSGWTTATCVVPVGMIKLSFKVEYIGTDIGMSFVHIDTLTMA